MGPPTGGMMEGLLVSNSPFLGDFLDPPLHWAGLKFLDYGNPVRTVGSGINGYFMTGSFVIIDAIRDLQQLQDKV